MITREESFLRDGFLHLVFPLIYDILIELLVLYIAAVSSIPGIPNSTTTTVHFGSRHWFRPAWFIELLLIFVVFYAFARSAQVVT